MAPVSFNSSIVTDARTRAEACQRPPDQNYDSISDRHNVAMGLLAIAINVLVAIWQYYGHERRQTRWHAASRNARTEAKTTDADRRSRECEDSSSSLGARLRYADTVSDSA
jgi:hypothetical protein